MKTPTINIPEGAGPKIVTFVAVGLGLWFLKRQLDKAAKNATDKLLAKDSDAANARVIISAMNPSGVDWLKRMDGTNSELIYTVAKQIKDLAKVQEYYKTLTKGGSLQDDLIKELSTDGYDKFLALATKGKSGSVKYSVNRTDIPANRWVVTTANANIRRTAKKESKYYPGNNIVKVVAKGRAVGASTGRYAYDESNDTTFIEFYTMGTNTKTAGKQFFYVAKSQVELLTPEQRTQREKAGQKILLEVLTGIGNINGAEGLQAVSFRLTTVYNEAFKPVAQVSPNVIIGFPILTMDTGKSRFTKLQTIQGLIRWVRADDLQLQKRL